MTRRACLRFRKDLTHRLTLLKVTQTPWLRAYRIVALLFFTVRRLPFSRPLVVAQAAFVMQFSEASTFADGKNADGSRWR